VKERTEAQKSGRDSLRRLSILMATVFIDMVGFSMVLTQLPFYAERFGATASLVGVLIAAFALAQLASAPLWGRFSDRHGRRPVILCGLAASAVAFLVFGLASSLWMLLISRLVQGAGGGTIGVVQAYVSDSSLPDQRAQGLAWVTAAASAGVMIGPALGSLSVRLGPSAPGFLAAGFCLVNIAFAWRWLPESRRPDPVAAADGTPIEGRPPVRLGKAMLAIVAKPNSQISILMTIYALGMLAFMSLNGVLVLYLERVFHMTGENIGFVYAYIAGAAFVMRAALLGPIVRKLGEVRTLRLGALFVALGLLTIPLANNFYTLALVALFMPVGTSLLFPVGTSMVSQLAHQQETGQTLGVQQAFGGISRLVGPLWSTAVFDTVSITAPFFITGGLMLLVRLYAQRVRPLEKAPPEPVEPVAVRP
jgi:MFS family permease